LIAQLDGAAYGPVPMYPKLYEPPDGMGPAQLGGLRVHWLPLRVATASHGLISVLAGSVTTIVQVTA
jgi:hypothetical protein